MSTVIFTAGTKGGTGKSTMLSLLIPFLRKKGYNPLLLDMDNVSKTLSRFFPDAQKVDITENDAHDILIEKVIKGEKLIIADLKAGTSDETLKWWSDVPFDSPRLQNVRFICIGVITAEPDGVQSFLSWASVLKKQVSYVVCKNERDGARFDTYESDEALDFREIYKPCHIKIESVKDDYMMELQRLNLTIANILDANDEDIEATKTLNGKPIGDVLSAFMVRARLRRFQNSVYDQFESILDLINV